MHRRGTPGWGAVVTVASLLGGLLAAGCDTDQPKRAPDIDASTYVVAIEGFLPPALDPEVRPVVYVVPVADETLALDNQVAVIDALAESYDVRFVDSPDAAVDGGTDGEPPRDDGMLLGLGRVNKEPPHTVRVEVYRERDEVEAHLVTVAFRRDRWTLVGDEPVEPEVLIGGD